LVLTLVAPADEMAPFVAASAGVANVRGVPVGFTPECIATLATGRGKDVVVKDIISLRRDAPIPAFPTRPQIITAYGDRIVADVRGGGGQIMRFVPDGVSLGRGEEWSVGLSNIVAIWFSEPPAETPVDPPRYAWLVAGVKNRDIVRFRNGDTARGTIRGFDAKAATPRIHFRPEIGEERELTTTEVAAIAFNPALVRAKKPSNPYLRVVLRNGSRIHLQSAALDRGELRGETLFGQKGVVPLSAIAAIDVVGGKAVPLSDLKPSKVELRGFLGVEWPWAADRDVHGAALTLQQKGGDSTFDKGVGTHPRTVLTYTLAGQYRRFEALVGLTPSAGDRGAVQVRVRIDGKEARITRNDRGVLTAGEPVRVVLDVTAAKEMILEVDFGPAGSVEGDVNWADARLIE
jgi:hypothetical protein